jgi:hypothetical protein
MFSQATVAKTAADTVGEIPIGGDGCGTAAEVTTTGGRRWTVPRCPVRAGQAQLAVLPETIFLAVGPEYTSRRPTIQRYLPEAPGYELAEWR